VKEDNEKEDNEKEDKENEDSDMSDSDVELPFDVNEELEVAWEVLEISRVLHAKEDDPDLESLSNVHFSLANVALESNNIEGATKEFEECLNLRKKKFGEDSRDVAEVYYMMGVILMYSKDHFEISKKNLEMAQEILKKSLKKSEEEGKTEEVEELKDILEEISERINDLINPPEEEEEQPNTDESLNNNSIPQTTPEKEVNDLTSTIKRKGGKRKLSEIEKEDTKVVKKKRENNQNEEK